MKKRTVLRVAGAVVFGVVLSLGVLVAMGQSGGLTNVFLKAISTAVQTLDNTIKVDDAAFTPATSSVSMMGAEFDDASPDSVDEGDAGAPRMSANRSLYFTLRDGAGGERGAGVIATILSLKSDLSSVAGTATNVDGGNSDAGTQTVTLADDDPAVASAATIATNTNTLAGSATTFQVPVKIDQGAAGITTILALEADKVIYLHALVGTMDVAGTVTISYDDDGAGTNAVTLTGNMPVAATGGMVIPFTADTHGCLRTATAKQLTITTTGGSFDGYAIVSKAAP